MYAVIFTAKIEHLDDDYFQTARRMRELATNEYGCVNFISATEGEQEIAISYWHTEADIVRWKQDPEHLVAQERGKSFWYKHYQVEIVEIKRQYSCASKKIDI